MFLYIYVLFIHNYFFNTFYSTPVDTADGKTDINELIIYQGSCPA